MENIDTIVVNGRGAWDRLVQAGLAKVVHQEHHLLPDKSTSITLQIGSGLGTTFIGWTQHLQVMQATATDKKVAISLAGQWIKEHISVDDHRGNVARSPVSTESTSRARLVGGFLEPTELGSLDDLPELLVDWLTRSEEVTIGHIGTYGRKPIIRVDLGEGLWAGLNADTTRDGVKAMLEAKSASAGKWRIAPNRNGLVNKVEPSTGGSSVRGWYFYLENPLDEQKEI